MNEEGIALNLRVAPWPDTGEGCSVIGSDDGDSNSMLRDINWYYYPLAEGEAMTVWDGYAVWADYSDT